MASSNASPSSLGGLWLQASRDPSLAGMELGDDSYLSWFFVVGVLNMPLNVLCLVNVYIRPRDFLGPFVVGQVGHHIK